MTLCTTNESVFSFLYTSETHYPLSSKTLDEQIDKLTSFHFKLNLLIYEINLLFLSIPTLSSLKHFPLSYKFPSYLTSYKIPLVLIQDYEQSLA